MTNTLTTCIDGHAHLAPLSFLQEIERSGKSFGVEVERTPDGHSLTFPNLAKLRPECIIQMMKLCSPVSFRNNNFQGKV